MLQYDKQVTISHAGTRRATQWPAWSLRWSELADRLRQPARGSETVAQYLALTKSQQDDLKDVGGFVGGALLGSRRKAACVTGRDVLTLDLDNLPPYSTQDTLARLDSLRCAYAVYSTRKHRPEAPRLRVLWPVSRTAGPDEYEPLLRKMAELGGLLPHCDPSTFEVARLMYWPSVCQDGEYIFQVGDYPFLDADGVLGLYADWRDIAAWPPVPGTVPTARLAAKQGDPTAKRGVVGAFCRIYDIYTAMDAFLPGVYLPTDQDDRFTFTGGSTTGGAIVYDSGLYLYSHHATDPCGGKLVNAFDLVRLHRFGDLDDDNDRTAAQSNKAMQKLAVADQAVAALLNQENYEKAVEVFSAPAMTAEADTEWMHLLDLHERTGLPNKTSNNVKVIVQHDPLLKDRVRLNLFSDAYVGQAPLPWELRKNERSVFQWGERDDKGLRNYLGSVYDIKGKDLIEDGLSEAASALAFDPVVDYLKSCRWDGVQRLDTVYIDYLGADDHPYTRAVARKGFVAAVARAMRPGIKYDSMTVVCGRQGIGKSTLFSRMGCGWFSDSLKTFEGKDAAELLQGVWICEIGELEGFSKMDVRTIRSFLSKQDDQYRAAYARKTEKHPRRCVFFGTTNDHEYLRDPTGNRRFLPIDAEQQPPTKKVFVDLSQEIVNQLWAEAFFYWQMGEPLILPPELEEEADRRRAAHFDTDPLQGQIVDFLEQPIPRDWLKMSMDQRRIFWGGGAKGDLDLVPRDRVCIMEILRECIGDLRPIIPRQDARRVADILAGLPDWERATTMRFGPAYGTQKGFKHVNQVCKPSPEM